MANNKKFYQHNDFEKVLKEYLKYGRERLECDLTGTREAIKLIARDKTREFIQTMDRGLNKEERIFLSALFISCMHKSFCYGYGIGRIEGKRCNNIYL
ncbi:MAG: hypothetical protein N3I35_14035 [Clostridia bacterium]|nr:hypothetical protein [Clostridia bacterium]